MKRAVNWSIVIVICPFSCDRIRLVCTESLHNSCRALTNEY